jgi:hypothetical protein
MAGVTLKDEEELRKHFTMQQECFEQVLRLYLQVREYRLGVFKNKISWISTVMSLLAILISAIGLIIKCEGSQ